MYKGAPTGAGHVFPPPVLMHICVGGTRARLPMSRHRFYLPEDLYELAVAELHGGARVDFEYACERFAPVYNEHELSLACRVVSEHHNEVHAAFDEDGWIADVARIWERARETAEASSSSEGEEASEGEAETLGWDLTLVPVEEVVEQDPMPDDGGLLPRLERLLLGEDPAPFSDVPPAPGPASRPPRVLPWAPGPESERAP